jgi:hypothetical protein
MNIFMRLEHPSQISSQPSRKSGSRKPGSRKPGSRKPGKKPIKLKTILFFFARRITLHSGEIGHMAFIPWPLLTGLHSLALVI